MPPKQPSLRPARSPRLLHTALLAAALLAVSLLSTDLLNSPTLHAQQTGVGTVPPFGAQNADPNHPSDAPTISPALQEQLANRRNSDRQKQLVADTEKLYQLAKELRDEVGKSNKDQLSVPIVKQSEQIEKLAKAVKERMRGY